MSERQQLGRSWDVNASAWCAAVREQRIESRRTVTDQAIVEAVMQQRPGRVLDLGCGEGWLARLLSAQGVTVVGVDASQPLVEAAQALGGGTFVHATYDELTRRPSLVGTDFDVVVANFSLLDDRSGELLAALATTLAAGARLIIQTVHPVFAGADQRYEDGWRVETFASFSGDWREPMPWYFRTLSSWSRAITAAGYALLEIREPTHPERAVPASVLFICSAH